jgi:hypothetical protein
MCLLEKRVSQIGEKMNSILANILAFTEESEQSKLSARPFKPLKCKVGQKLCLGIICFSKDRPFQLHQLLSTIDVYLKGEYSTFVIYSSQSYTAQYQKLKMLHPNVQFIEEYHFACDLQNALNSLHANEVTHIMFCVDDMILIDYVDLR